MADFTTTYAIDNTQEYNVRCRTPGAKRVVVQENFDSTHPPTSDLLQRGTVADSEQIRISMGTPAIFTAPAGFAGNEVVGTIQAASGSITVQQIENFRL